MGTPRLVILLVCLLASGSQAEFFTNGGFDTGDLTGWDEPGPFANSGTSVQTSASFDSQTILPQAGTHLAATDIVGYGDIFQDFGSAEQGILTFYFYRSQAFSGSYNPAMFFKSGTGTGEEFNLYWGWEGGNTLLIRGGVTGSELRTSTTEVSIGQWNKVELVIDSSGIDISFNDTPVPEFQNLLFGTGMTAVREVRYQTGWGGARGALDSFSFVETDPPGPTNCQDVLDLGFSMVTDLNNDCYTNEADLNLFFMDWVRCVDPGNVVCETPWTGSGSGGGNMQVSPPVTENPAAGAAVAPDFLDGFESGHFGRWTTAQSDLGHDNFLDVDISVGGLYPNSGNFMASIPQTTATPMNVEKVLDQAGQGTLTGYLSIESFHANYSAGLEFVASDGSSGAAILVNRAGNNRVEYRLDSGGYMDTGITATAGVWTQIQFVVDVNGVDGYWDGQALFLDHNSPTKDVSKIVIGSRLNTLRCFYDDVSFPFPQTEPPDPAENLWPPVMQDNGDPFFVLGYYAHETYPQNQAFKYDSLYATFASQSINTVLHWGSNWASAMSAQIAAADSAFSQNLKYIAMLHHFAIIDDPVYDESLIDDQVNNLWFKPSLFGWYLADEPQLSDSAVYPPRLQMLYDRIRARDFGLHPQFVVFVAPVESYLRHEKRFSATHDVMMNDDYPVRDGTAEFANDMWSVASWTRQQVLLCKINGSKQAQINVTQATGVNGWSGFRLPTFNEQRYLSYAPIVEGSRGLLWWDWGNLGDPVYVQARADYRADVLGPIATEISDLIPAIVSDSTAVTVTSDRDIDTLGHGIEDVTTLFGKEDPNRLILIAVNHTPSTLASVAFTLTGGALGSADGASAVGIEVAYEGRIVQRQPVSGNTWTLTDTFTPYDVNVYVLNTLEGPADCSDAIARGYGLASDYNADCHVSFVDYAVFVTDWLLCIHPEDPQCDHPW